jgi:hypothetical protein
MADQHGTHNADDGIVSLANVRKPAALFGGGRHRIYHGATQTPWVAKVLEDWQRTHR